MRFTSRKRAMSLGALVMMAASNIWAATPSFNNITSEDFDKIAKELAANTSLHSVTPAGSMGSIFGFELGLVGGITKTPEIDAIVKKNSADTNVSAFPHAGLLGAVTVPFGITAEVVFVPQVNVSGFEYKQMAAALKWTLSDVLLPMLPLNLAVRGYLSKSEFTYAQTFTDTITNTPVSSSVKYDGTVTGLQILASPKLIPIIEPYVGVGFLSGNSKLSTSAGSLFASQKQTEERSPTSTEFLLGADVRLLLIGFGLEYSRSFDTDSITGKFSLRF